MNLGLSERHAGIAAAAGGDWTAAERHFEAATRRAESLQYALELAELPRWRAQMLLWRGQRDDRQRAAELLRAAREAYAALAMPRHVAIADAMRV